jgi:hypothetical protein
MHALRNGPKDVPAKKLWEHLDREYPVPADWVLQDIGKQRTGWFGPEEDRTLDRDLLAAPLKELGEDIPTPLRQQVQQVLAENPQRRDPRWLDLYLVLCERRREKRLRTLRQKAARFLFAKHFNMGGSHYAYTEGQSDAQAERIFQPGTELCLWEMNGLDGRITRLLADPQGVIRDPNVSWDGKRVLFAWKKSDRQDDYHLYEIDLDRRAVRQLTFGLGFADYEPAYLPNGDIVFNSTRCVQTVDCWWTEVSNLYTCDRDGRFLRRLTFDQVHDNFPQVLDDGRVIYTRWEYNDRGQIYVQGLFQMNADGTAQAEFYGDALSSTPPAIGNGSWDVKRVLGTTPIDEQGSACFTVPARTPVYFQVLDGDRQVIQTMRSWSTLQPGEVLACVGCHEHKNTVPPPSTRFRRQPAGPRPLISPAGGVRGFSFLREIQPILDRQCVRCHDAADQEMDLRAEPIRDHQARRLWARSYLSLVHAQRGEGSETDWRGNDAHPLLNWISPQSAPPLLAPYTAGSARSDLVKILRQGHQGVKVTTEDLDRIRCWIDLGVPYCGDYTEAHDWSERERAKYDHYLAKRRAMERIEAGNIQQFMAAREGQSKRQ